MDNFKIIKDLTNLVFKYSNSKFDGEIKNKCDVCEKYKSELLENKMGIDVKDQGVIIPYIEFKKQVEEGWYEIEEEEEELEKYKKLLEDKKFYMIWKNYIELPKDWSQADVRAIEEAENELGIDRENRGDEENLLKIFNHWFEDEEKEYYCCKECSEYIWKKY